MVFPADTLAIDALDNTLFEFAMCLCVAQNMNSIFVSMLLLLRFTGTAGCQQACKPFLQCSDNLPLPSLCYSLSVSTFSTFFYSFAFVR